MGKAYKEHQAEVWEEQSYMSYDEIKELMSKYEYMAELDNLPKQKHKWTDRGAKYTCENAGHPWHEAWKMKQTA